MPLQCSICRMEFDEDEEMLRVLKCGHAEHAECLDQWLAINKCCPLCQCEVIMPDVSAKPHVCVAATPEVLGTSTSTNVPDRKSVV